MPGVNDALEDEALPLSDLIQTAQQLSQSWEKLLFASGGALELTKRVNSDVVSGFCTHIQTYGLMDAPLVM